MTPQAALSVGKVGIDLQGRRIKIDGSDVELTQREFDLAVLLFQNLGRVFSRDDLFSRIWLPWYSIASKGNGIGCYWLCRM